MLEPSGRGLGVVGAVAVFSDLSRLKHRYRECVAHFAETITWLSDHDRALITGLNVCRVTGWQR